LELIKFLLKHGADANLATGDASLVPLEAALMMRDKNVIAYLVSVGAKIEAKSDILNELDQDMEGDILLIISDALKSEGKG
jgi:ankyrin repeat protein